MSKKLRPAQKQKLPGDERKMRPAPIFENPDYQASGKLKDKIAIITGADSGIGRAIAILFAKEGANIVGSYLNEDKDADITKNIIEKLGRECLFIKGDISKSKHCNNIVDKTIEKFHKLDVLVNNAGEQDQTNSLEDITDEKLEHIFRVNVFSMFYLTRAALKNLKKGSCIINTVSIVAYKGNPLLLDYSATKAAAVGFTRALSQSLVEKGIRVNGVAPGPIWTPLIPASFDAKKVAEFGSESPMKRAGEPYELAPAYVYLACEADSSYVTGQVIHVNGGKIVNG